MKLIVPALQRSSSRIACGMACLLLGLGCASSGMHALQSGDYATVPLKTIQKAGASGQADGAAHLRTMLEARLRDPASVSIDQTMEALVALGNLRSTEAAQTVRACATQDPAEEVRYVALDVLNTLEGTGSLPFLELRGREDASSLVRTHALELASKDTIPQ
jgi:hypothetical protein